MKNKILLTFIILMVFSSLSIFLFSCEPIIYCKASVGELIGDGDIITYANVSPKNVIFGKAVIFSIKVDDATTTFLGWFDNAEGIGKPLSIEQKYYMQNITSDITLYPKVVRGYELDFVIRNISSSDSFTIGGLCIDNMGYIYVTDYSNNCVYKLNSAGMFVTKWGRSGYGDGQFRSPSEICVDNMGFVYVADENNNRIQKFDSNGNFITKWGRFGQFDFFFEGICADNDGYIYVLDDERVHKYDSNGVLVNIWGSSGEGDGQFDCPSSICADNNGFIYISDTCNSRIQKFDTNGNFITKWGRFGFNIGFFDSLRGICVDDDNNVFVVDSRNYRIQKFDSNGNFITKWGRHSSIIQDDEYFHSLYIISADIYGNIYVVDNRDCIKVYKKPE